MDLWGRCGPTNPQSSFPKKFASPPPQSVRPVYAPANHSHNRPRSGAIGGLRTTKEGMFKELDLGEVSFTLKQFIVGWKQLDKLAYVHVQLAADCASWEFRQLLHNARTIIEWQGIRMLQVHSVKR
ncbi:MAG: hypothetical protein GY820_00455 [Gammaproteobacteria bacterium]|nr:hypothetical protein [Gammaproteobacteria bacterium]